MKSKNIDKSLDKTTTKAQRTQSEYIVHVSSEMEERVIDGTNSNERGIALSGLRLMLERLVAYFQQRANLEDKDTLIFGLCHLFSHVDALYCETLPALASIIHTRTSSSAIKTRIAFRYALWTHLQQMQQHVERIESLCHLLNRTVPHLLSTLDMPDMAQVSKDEVVSMREPNDSAQNDTERWQQAYERLTTRLNAWQERNEERLTFASSVTQQAKDSSSPASVSSARYSPDTALDPSSSTIRPLLTRIDASLMLVLDSAGAIFGDIVPDFQGFSHGDDEVVATLLFDLMQQADLLLIQCDALFRPLQDFIRHYMLFE